MKFLSQVLFSAGLIGFALTGCERHEFEDTKILHLEHGSHGEDHSADPAEGGHAPGVVAPAKEAPAAAAPAPAPAVKEVPRATGL